MNVTCPHCQVELRVRDSLAGRRIQCPHCAESFALEEREAPAELLDFEEIADDSAAAYSNIVFLPMIFISGVFYDVDNVPTFLRDIADALPLALDGKLLPGVPPGATSFTISPIDRGTHTLMVSILDADGRGVCQSAGVTFHVRQPSLLAPNRRPAPASRPRPTTPRS